MTRSRVPVVPAILALAGAAASQTTWSSFEDRANHALTTEFNTGMVAMFGGASTNGSGLLLDDTITRNNQTWQPQTPPSKPTGRKEHAMAGGLGPGDAPFVILFGGLKSTGTGTVRSNDTWRYDGSSWGEVPVPTGARPAMRSGHGMVQDLLRNKVILIGGLGGIVPLGDVWEFDPIADSWTQRLPAAPVMPGRYGHAMAWDPVTGNVLVFGGSGFRQDTWEYNPVANTWTNRTPAGPNPVPGRVNASMAYHPLADQIVLFGGATATGVLDDTWVWDRNTSTWQPTTPTTRPPARRGQAMTPENDGSTVLVHGGTDGAGNTLRGTWAWTGTDWTTNLPPPSPRKGAAMAYDGARRRHVLFGGTPTATGADSNETWELDQFTWRRRTPTNSPSARSGAGVAFDPARNRTVLYGGRSGGPCGTELGDTWEWDGNNWSFRNPATSPPPAGGIQAVFDTSRNRTWVLIGSEMWSYSGGNWMAHPQPTARWSPSAAYDSVRRRLTMFGGMFANGATSNETWEWDGGGWTLRIPASSPAPRFAASMGHDPVAGCTVLVGGVVGGGNPARYNDTWFWNGSNWVNGPVLTELAGCPLTYDAARARLTMFGGANANPVFFNTTYGFDCASSTWYGVSTANAPSPRAHHAMAYDPVRARVVLFGGSTGTDLNDTWEYDGTNWIQRQPATIPQPRNDPAMVFDSRTQQMLMFGGGAPPAPSLGDTWTWNGSDWQQRQPAAAPPPRSSMVLASTGTRTVMWGGWSNAGLRGDMWEWDGLTWTLIDSGPPPWRTSYGAAYDARRDRLVVFGGATSCNRSTAAYHADTWEWDGDSWLQRFPATSPSPRAWSRLTWDEARSRVVLFGGADASADFSDTWEWNGTDWLQRLPVASPPATEGHALSFDQHRLVTVGFGTPGTWDYGPTFPASIAPYGQGCQGTAGVPELRPTPWAGPWLGDRMEIDILRRPPGFGLMVYGFSDTLWNGLPLPLPIAALGIPAGNGCTLQSSVEWSEFLPFTGRYTSFPMPTLPIALGFTMHMQAGFLDAGTPGFPVVVSQGLHITFGAK